MKLPIHVLFLSFALLLPGLATSALIEPPVLRVSSDTEPLTLDWNDARTSVDRFMTSFMMRALLKYDATNQPVCDLCKSYRISGDGKTYVFELKSDEVWSDGVKLEAKHFVDSFHRLLTPGNHFKAAGELKDVASVRAEATDKLEITLAHPLAELPHLLTTAVTCPIRKELLKPASDHGENHASTAVLGPYLLAAWEHGKRVVLEGNPEYKGERPVYRVEFVLGTHAQLLAKFKDGKLDILSTPTSEDLIKLPGQRVQVNPYWATRNLVFNTRHVPVSDLALRKAILHALERESLPAFLRNGERRVTGLMPPGIAGYRDLPLATADPATAAKERKGIAGVGVAPAGKPLELMLLTRDLDADRRVAEWVGTQLERIQVRLKTRAVPAGTYFSELEAGHFDLVLNTWSFETASPLDVLETLETHSQQNHGGWTNVGFDALLGELLRQPDLAKAAPIVDQLTQLVEIKDVAVIPLGYPTQPFMLGQRVVSFAITPFGDPDLVKIQLKL